MNYKITFSTYVNATGHNTSKSIIKRDLSAIARANHIQGFTLTDQDGYWAGEFELSYALTLLDTTPQQAKMVATLLKRQYHQDAVILERLADTEVEFI